jgi:hypothetical protein
MTAYYACYARSIRSHLALRDGGTLRSPTDWIGEIGMGRESGSESETGLRTVLAIRLSRSERDLVTAKATEAGLRPATYIRQVALRTIVAPVKCDIPPINREAWASLARVCSNLNQYQLAINEGRASGHSQDVLWQLSDQVEALRRELIGIRDGDEGEN